jgi:hypothetical protein
MNNGTRNGYVVTGVKVTIQGTEDTEPHTVTISSAGEATIECGYRDSEQKYLEYQKRTLAGWMQDELGAESSEFHEFDL